MGYGLGVFLLVVGLILALAVEDAISGVDLTMVGWIMAIGGVLVLVLTAVTLNSRKARGGAVSTTTHADGSQTVQRQEPPAV
ncbi:DUF6458 family protein [Nocardioides sp. SOB77]|uniref:DUF6458 family protein n=1 Tax=Nocardioides oceani TaxID=3058369 RepID=A0ABT8FDZ8_9ACTN|nr:DUF6458 family protein [Nocardioides oceani]MDN4172908.1 DUF6458 family protein [Nocardioides oceani]